MRFLIALILTISAANGFRDDPDDTLYYIKSAVTSKYLFVDSPPDDEGVARNVCIEDTKNKIPDPRPNALFYVVANDAIGPYYNIINLGTNSTLFASEFEVGVEIDNTVHKVMSWVDAEHKNAPESTWNIRHFNQNLYILNYDSGSYLYTNDYMYSPAVLTEKKRLALLMPSEGAGRVQGTQWLIIRREDVDGRSMDVGAGGMVNLESKVAREENSTGGEEVVEIVGNVTSVEGKKEIVESETDNVTEGVESKEVGKDKQGMNLSTAEPKSEGDKTEQEENVTKGKEK